jgi:hypothetical protein
MEEAGLLNGARPDDNGPLGGKQPPAVTRQRRLPILASIAVLGRSPSLPYETRVVSRVVI